MYSRLSNIQKWCEYILCVVLCNRDGVCSPWGKVKVKFTPEEATKVQKGKQSYHHHKHKGLGPLICCVSRVTAARANASSVFQFFSFLVVCSGMISKGFGFVLGASKPRPSAKGAHPYRKRGCLEALRLASTKLTQRGTGYPSWGHPTQIRISRGSRVITLLFL